MMGRGIETTIQVLQEQNHALQYHAATCWVYGANLARISGLLCLDSESNRARAKQQHLCSGSAIVKIYTIRNSVQKRGF